MAKSGATPTQRPPAGTEPALTVSAPPPEAKGHEGDDALVAMFNRIRDELVSTLVYLLGNADDAQDAAQEAFLKCWRVRHTLGDVQNLRAWIFRVGMNTARDVQRSAWSRKSRPLPEDELMMPGIEDKRAGRSLEEQEALDRLRLAITELRQDEKEVFLLRQNGELTYEQIAEIRSAPVGTVKTQMRTALIKLRKVLNPRGESSAE
jgi:RNA polymerase sigma-70 factor (ECF subfamily)